MKRLNIIKLLFNFGRRLVPGKAGFIRRCLSNEAGADERTRLLMTNLLDLDLTCLFNYAHIQCL
jgi:hypothetical protein